MRKLLVGLLAAFAVACGNGAGSSVMSLNKAAPTSVANVVVAENPACDSLSLCYTISWSAVSDSRGAADKYRNKVAKDGVLLKDSTGTATFLSYNFVTPKPATGSVNFVDTVWSSRRGLQSAPSAIAWKYTRPDAPPPPPPLPTVDSSTIVASMHVWSPFDTVIAMGPVCSVLTPVNRVAASECIAYDVDGVLKPQTILSCTFLKFKDNHVALADNSKGIKACEDRLALEH